MACKNAHQSGAGRSSEKLSHTQFKAYDAVPNPLTRVLEIKATRPDLATEKAKACVVNVKRQSADEIKAMVKTHLIQEYERSAVERRQGVRARLSSAISFQSPARLFRWSYWFPTFGPMGGRFARTWMVLCWFSWGLVQ